MLQRPQFALPRNDAADEAGASDSGVADRVTTLTWVAVGLLLLESAVLVVSGWTCPLTLLAERQGAPRGSVADIFLPAWFADRIFPICGTLYGVALIAIAWRMF